MAKNPISEFLKQFRKRIEKETGENIASAVDVPALLLLDDLCTFAKAYPKEVMGERAVRKVKQITG